MLGTDRGMWVDWKRVDLYGKMGVSKIVREIEGKVGNEWGWVMGKLGERFGLSGVKGLVNWGVFGKWMGMGGKFKWGEVRGGWWLNDDWFMIDLLNHSYIHVAEKPLNYWKYTPVIRWYINWVIQ